MGTIEHQPALPIWGNIDETHTAGVFQYDVTMTEQGDIQPATHENVATAAEFAEQTLHFLQSYLEKGVAEIVDPYQTLGVK